MFTSLGKMLIRLAASVFAGLAAGFGTIAYFALRDPDVWAMDRMRDGPPFGPVMLAIAMGFGTAAVALGYFFWDNIRPNETSQLSEDPHHP